MNVMDKTIQSSFPLVAATRYEELAESGNFGMRFIAAKSGLWREINLQWVRVVHRIAKATGPFNLPYGDLSESCELKFSKVPLHFWKQLRADAVAALPNEMSAAFVWNGIDDTWRYAKRVAKIANPGYISYDEVELQEGEQVVIDMHSHGTGPAFFSSTDDADDAGSMRISGVIGNVDREEITLSMRLNMPQVSWLARLEVDGTLEVSI